ncbi:putative ring-cleaving dioxygenase MhqO [Paenibacillus faecis]|uniref:ring-cleaving dioxygenase n=1 Tax=Paenibacillus faecis TaxID=862114 RepID=UPI001B243511|nr:ring-cleaving dioxygenase [Paenibacillus faecis]GIO86008.1 putative ring-cleaving dioxygenase MhqO [Paenibacillus faecis]
MTQRTAGIHHITAFVPGPQETVDFYSGILGLRLVKKTINFDAPEVYHLYFGDEMGHPGTIITFFPWPGSRRGRIGGGQVGVTTYAIPPETLDFWEERLRRFKVSVEKRERFGETVLRFRDPSGLVLELVEREEGKASAWSFGGIPADHAIKGFGGAVLYSLSPEKTARLLEQVFGMEKIGEYGSYVRYKTAGDLGNIIDINVKPVEPGNGGAGTVHHIAWRAKDDEEHAAWRNKLAGLGYQVTPIVDRQYFNAVYFREEGGILFEIATDPPGFARDEPVDKLGEKLMLPDWYEEQRKLIEANLEPIEVRILKEDQV